tara:strand:+ start:4351 stop:4794 length:444 start_codon:yes stop_codon:yes gene_type:complete
MSKKIGRSMALFERDDVATPYSTCKYCKRPTRSHVLEPAKYEEFTTEVVINASDEFANSHWEEVEEVVKARKAKDPIVLCHKCWLEKKSECESIIDKEFDSWMESPMENISRIHSIAHTCQYYKFGGDIEVKTKEMVKKVKELIRND